MLDLDENLKYIILLFTLCSYLLYQLKLDSMFNKDGSFKIGDNANGSSAVGKYQMLSNYFNTDGDGVVGNLQKKLRARGVKGFKDTDIFNERAQDLLAIELLKITGPLAVTSANRSGENDVTSNTEAEEIFGSNVTEYLEGASVHGSGSTIIDFRVEGGEILREGPLKWPPSYC